MPNLTKKLLRKTFLLPLSMAAWAGVAGLSAQATAWEPTKPVEIVVPAGAGGASD